MTKLLIIADDFTGALDTGVQLAASGASTRVFTDPHSSWKAAKDVQVLVIDAETRHLTAEKAGEIVRKIVKQAAEQGILHIYKKTDSALRGNIGAELTALLEASGEKQLAFLPAFPQINRRTVSGIHYIGDLPVAESVFGRDPFEPVRYSEIASLIGQQSSVPVHNVPVSRNAEAADDMMDQGDGIFVYDASTQEDLKSAGQKLNRMGKTRILAGCAGFAAELPELLELRQDGVEKLPEMDSRFVVICGSVNPITVAQMDEAEKEGFVRRHLTSDQKLFPEFWQKEEGKRKLKEYRDLLKKYDSVIFDANDGENDENTDRQAADFGLSMEDMRVRIGRSVGKMVSGLLDGDVGTLLITGGDTLLQCMNELKVYEMRPICELSAGVVLSTFHYGGNDRYVISKSGGFGDKKLLIELKTRLQKQGGDKNEIS